MSFADRHRANSFGDDAALYDRARPTYPPALIDDLLAGGVRRAVDVGCGTGKVARLLLTRGVEVVGVEADDRMAAVARGHGIEVDVCRFEDWNGRNQTYELLTAGQAWHWVDPEAGLRKAADVLRPGGLLALFWTGVSLPPEVLDRVTPIYERIAPDELRSSVALGTAKPDDAGDLAAVQRSGCFVDVERRAYEWEQPSTVAAWIESLPTHSGHRTLPPGLLDQLLGEVYGALAPVDREIVYRYRTGGVFARRSPT